MAFDLIERVGARSESDVVACLARRVGGTPALIDRGADGRTMLATLDDWLSGKEKVAPADPSLAPEELAAQVLHQCADPGSITQGAGLHNTCAAAAIQYLLAENAPAELARMVRGLASEGSVRLRNGDRMARVADSVVPDRYVRDAHGTVHSDPSGPIADTRSAVDRIFQAAMMDYANGADRYSDKDDKSYGRERWYTGLYAPQQRRALEAVFGSRYARIEGSRGLDRLRRLFDPILVDLRWVGGSHAVVVDRVENGRVYFVNPFGPWRKGAPALVDDPPRRVEDLHSRESMRIDDFERAFECAYVGV
jgi:hypothetical protein